MLPLPEPKGAGQRSWQRGTNTASSMRALRIAVPVGMAIGILDNADIEAFADQSGVECCLADLKHPDYPVHFLKRPQSQPLRRQVLDLRGTFFDQPLRCKTIELALNDHKAMIRYAFQSPSKRGDHGKTLQHADWMQKCKRYLLQWVKLIKMEKTRQMHCAASMRPPVPEWPEGKDVLHMPIVLWLTVSQKRGQKRRAAAADGGHTDWAYDRHTRATWSLCNGGSLYSC